MSSRRDTTVKLIKSLKDSISLKTVLEDEGHNVQPAGGKWISLCPDHDEKTPSFTIYPDDHYHCYGCGEHGDLIDLVQLLHGVDLPGALRLIEEKYPDEFAAARTEAESLRQGVDHHDDDSEKTDNVDDASLRQQDPEGRASADRTQKRPHRDGHDDGYRMPLELLRRLERRVCRCREDLRGCGPAREYLRSRGFSDETLEAGGLGWDADEQAVVIPVRDLSRDVVGLGYRYHILEADPAQEGPAVNEETTGSRPRGPRDRKYKFDKGFKKGQYLYGADDALPHVSATGTLYVVEGQFDRLAMAQMGYRNTVASMGAVLTSAQALLIADQSVDIAEIVLVPDNDLAGLNSVEANYRTLRVVTAIPVKVVVLDSTIKDANDLLVAGSSLPAVISCHAFMMRWILASEPDRLTQVARLVEVLEDATPEDRGSALKFVAAVWGVGVSDVAYVLYRCVSSLAKPAVVTLTEAASEYLAKVKDAHRRIRVGYADLDAMIRGVWPGEVLVVMARPSVGKTTLLINIIVNVLSRGKPINTVFFSLELPAAQILERVMMILLGHTQMTVEKMAMNEPDRYEDSVKELHGRLRSLRLVDTGGLTVEQAKQQAEVAAITMAGPIGLIVIDYLQLLRAEVRGGVAYERVSYVARALKELAKAMDCAVIVACQTSRQAGDGTRRVKLTHARDSGVVEESADIVLGLSRDETFSARSTPTLKIEVLKSRRGRTGGPVRLRINETSRISEPQAEPLDIK